MGQPQSVEEKQFDKLIHDKKLCFSTNESKDRFKSEFHELIKLTPEHEGLVGLMECAALSIEFAKPKCREDPRFHLGHAAHFWPKYSESGSSSHASERTIASAVTDTHPIEELRTSNHFNDFQRILKSSNMPRRSMASLYVVWKMEARSDLKSYDEMLQSMREFVKKHVKTIDLEKLSPAPTISEDSVFGAVVKLHGLMFTSAERRQHLLLDWSNVVGSCPAGEGVDNLIDFFVANLDGRVNPRFRQKKVSWPQFSDEYDESRLAFVRNSLHESQPMEAVMRPKNPFNWFHHMLKVNGKRLPSTTTSSLYTVWKNMEKEKNVECIADRDTLFRQFLEEHFD